MRHFFLALSTAMVFTACENETSFEAEDLQDNPQLQEEVYTTIINSEELLTEFMRQAMNDPDVVHQVMMEEGFMEEMFDQESMQYMMRQNGEMMNMMMNRMMQFAGEDSVFRERMFGSENWQQMMEMHEEHGSMMHE